MQADNILIEIEKTGFTVDKGFNQIAFVLDNLSAGQIPYCCIYNCNAWLYNNFGLNFSIFYTENSSPCVKPKFARFHVRDTVYFTGTLIATSLSTALAIKNATRAKRYFYVNDPEWLRSHKQITKEDFESIMFDDKIIKFCRSNDYKTQLEILGIKVLPNIVEDFNVSKILEIVNG
jgi:hypothetical protein